MSASAAFRARVQYLQARVRNKTATPSEHEEYLGLMERFLGTPGAVRTSDSPVKFDPNAEHARLGQRAIERMGFKLDDSLSADSPVGYAEDMALAARVADLLSNRVALPDGRVIPVYDGKNYAGDYGALLKAQDSITIVGGTGATRSLAHATFSSVFADAADTDRIVLLRVGASAVVYTEGEGAQAQALDGATIGCEVGGRKLIPEGMHHHMDVLSGIAARVNTTGSDSTAPFPMMRKSEWVAELSSGGVQISVTTAETWDHVPNTINGTLSVWAEFGLAKY